MMALRVESRGIQEEKLKLFDENTRFVSSCMEASIKTFDKDKTYQLSIYQDGTTNIYTFDSFHNAYKQYERSLQKRLFV